MGGRAKHLEDPAADRAAELLRVLSIHKTDEPRLAEPMERLTARLVDIVVWLVLAVATDIVATSIDARVFPDDRSAASQDGFGVAEELHPITGWSAMAVLTVAMCVYEVPATARTGQHFAKRRMRLRVVGPGGQPPGRRRALVRLAVLVVPSAVALGLFMMSFGSTSGLGFAAMALQALALGIPGAAFLRDDKRGLHDLAAGTRVLADR